MKTIGTYLIYFSNKISWICTPSRLLHSPPSWPPPKGLRPLWPPASSGLHWELMVSSAPCKIFWNFSKIREIFCVDLFFSWGKERIGEEDSSKLKVWVRLLLIDGLHNAHKLVKIQQLLSYKLLFEVFLCSSLLLFYFCLSYVFLKLFLAVYYFFTDGMKEFLDVFFELGLVGRR